MYVSQPCQLATTTKHKTHTPVVMEEDIRSKLAEEQCKNKMLEDQVEKERCRNGSLEDQLHQLDSRCKDLVETFERAVSFFLFSTMTMVEWS